MDLESYRRSTLYIIYRYFADLHNLGVAFGGQTELLVGYSGSSGPRTHDNNVM